MFTLVFFIRGSMHSNDCDYFRQYQRSKCVVLLKPTQKKKKILCRREEKLKFQRERETCAVELPEGSQVTQGSRSKAPGAGFEF